MNVQEELTGALSIVVTLPAVTNATDNQNMNCKCAFTVM